MHGKPVLLQAAVTQSDTDYSLGDVRHFQGVRHLRQGVRHSDLGVRSFRPGRASVQGVDRSRPA